jgi:hypothetical protein
MLQDVDVVVSSSLLKKKGCDESENERVRE